MTRASLVVLTVTFLAGCDVVRFRCQVDGDCAPFSNHCDVATNTCRASDDTSSGGASSGPPVSSSAAGSSSTGSTSLVSSSRASSSGTSSGTSSATSTQASSGTSTSGTGSSLGVSSSGTGASSDAGSSSSAGTSSSSAPPSSSQPASSSVDALSSSDTAPSSSAAPSSSNPALPAAPVLAGVMPTGPSTNTHPHVLGTAPVGAVVAIYAGTCTGMPLGQSGVLATSALDVAVTVPLDTTTTLVANTTVAGLTSPCSSPVSYTHDGTAPSTTAASVLDGNLPSMDAAWIHSTTTVLAQWSGFSDDNGVTTYDHCLSRSNGCFCDERAAVSAGNALNHQFTTLALTENGTYFNCVRALDAAGNASPWVASNGFSVDSLPPTILSISPLDAATNVARDTSLTLTFSESTLDASSFQPNQWTVSSATGAITGTATLSGNHTLFVPSGLLAPKAHVTASLATGLRDISGNPLASGTMWSFDVRDGAWSTTVAWATGGVNDPRIATMNHRGDVMLGWTALGSSAVMSARVTAAGVSDLREIAPGPNGNVVELALHDDGSAAAILVDYVAPNQVLVGAYLPPGAGTGWEPTALATLPGYPQSAHVAIAPDGSDVACWADAASTPAAVSCSTRSAAGWSAPYAVNPSTNALTSRLCFNANGDGWLALTTSTGDLKAYRLSTTASPVEYTLDTGLNPSTYAFPSIACDGVSGALAAWKGATASRSSHFVGGAWTTPYPYCNSPSATCYGATVAMSSNGMAMLVYRSEPSFGAATTYERFSLNGGSVWSGATTSTAMVAQGMPEGHLVMDRWGNAMFLDQGHTGLSVLRREPGTNQLVMSKPASSAGNASYQSVLVGSPDGRAAVIWLETFGSGVSSSYYQ